MKVDDFSNLPLKKINASLLYSHEFLYCLHIWKMYELLNPHLCSHGLKTLETYDLLHVALLGPHRYSISPPLQLLK